jgi:hypothetical protein
MQHQPEEKAKLADSQREARPAGAAAEPAWALLHLQDALGNRAVQRLLRARRQPGAPEGPADVRPRGTSSGPLVQRLPTDGAAGPAPGPTGPTPAEAGPGETAAPGLIVGDDAADLAPGQMRKSEFLAQLRAAVCRTAEEALAGTIWSAVGCPWIDHWLGYYGGRDSRHLERALHKYAPETAGATTARDYIPLACARVRQGIRTWTETDEVTGVPEGAGAGLPRGSPGGEGGVLAALAGAGAGLAGRVLSGVGGLLFKSRPGGASAADPGAVQARLGAGRALDGGVRARMESAFGEDFSHVRTHTDAAATELAGRLEARAFTVGSDIAFGPGEYQPGTPVGDALIAHELAHVVQQGGATPTPPLVKGSHQDSALEEEADLSAVGAVVTLWGGAKAGLAHAARNALPRLRSGLRLQRCGHSLPTLRAPQAVLQESQTFEQQALADIERRALDLIRTTQDRAQQQVISEATVNVQSDLSRALIWLRQSYQEELADAGNDTTQRREAQQRFEQEVQRLRESYMLQFELTRRWGVTFTTGRTETESQRQPPRQRWRVRAWSREELETIDRILSRVPGRYLQNLRSGGREIQRAYMPGAREHISGNAAAAWGDGERVVTIYDIAFQHPDEMSKYILHEVGHSTVQERAVGGFPHLPPQDWMDLSDWKASTRQSLDEDLGLSDNAVEQALQHFDENAPRPIPIGNRMVIPDKYETTFPPTRFFHYAVAHDGEFVSNEARSHPAEDLAASFASYLLDPDWTREKLDVRPPDVTDKWDYLVTHYPDRLRR